MLTIITGIAFYLVVGAVMAAFVNQLKLSPNKAPADIAVVLLWPLLVVLTFGYLLGGLLYQIVRRFGRALNELVKRKESE